MGDLLEQLNSHKPPGINYGLYRHTALTDFFSIRCGLEEPWDGGDHDTYRRYMEYRPPRDPPDIMDIIGDVRRTMLRYGWTAHYGLSFIETMQLPYSQFMEMKDAIIRHRAKEVADDEISLNGLLDKLSAAQENRNQAKNQQANKKRK